MLEKYMMNPAGRNGTCSAGQWRTHQVAARRGLPEGKSANVFGQPRKQPKMFRAGLYARVSTNDQQTLTMQNRAMREYAAREAGRSLCRFNEVNSGAVR